MMSVYVFIKFFVYTSIQETGYCMWRNVFVLKKWENIFNIESKWKERKSEREKETTVIWKLKNRKMWENITKNNPLISLSYCIITLWNKRKYYLKI